MRSTIGTLFGLVCVLIVRECDVPAATSMVRLPVAELGSMSTSVESARRAKPEQSRCRAAEVDLRNRPPLGILCKWENFYLELTSIRPG